MIRINQEDISYLLCRNTKTATVTSINHKYNTITIPKSVKHYFTTYIIKSLSRESFYGISLETLKFSNDSNVVCIDESAFARANIQNIEFPKSLTTISNLSFEQSEIQQIDLSNTQITYIGKEAFRYSNLVNIKLPKSIKQIEYRAFFECKCLNSIEIPEDSDLYCIGDEAFAFSSLKNFNIPLKITEFNPTWFYNTPNITNLTFTPSLNRSFKWLDDKQTMIVSKSSSLNEYDTIVFATRLIKYAMIGSDIKHISSYAFDLCTKLTKVEFANDSKLQSIGIGAFSSTSIDSISIPENVSYISTQAFFDCKRLKKIKIPEKSMINNLSYGILQYTPINTIIIPSSVHKIEETSLADCHNLKAIEYLGNNLSFHCFAFNYCCTAKIFSCPNAICFTFDRSILRRFSTSTTFYFNSGAIINTY